MVSENCYTPPELGLDAFHCPHCEVYASQSWSDLKTDPDGRVAVGRPIDNAKVGHCSHCREDHIWMEEEMIYPQRSPAPLPADDMPDDVKEDFKEARRVVSDSPKAAAALLRRSIEELIDELLDDPEDHLYSDIQTLADEEIIDDRIRKAFDTIRVSGNDYTHAGRIYAQDNRKKALDLFELTNIIVRTTISEDRIINELYDDIPETKKRENNN